MHPRILLVALTAAILFGNPPSQAAGNSVDPLAPPARATLFLTKGMPVVFAWQGVSEPGSYRFQLSRTADFRDLVADRDTDQTSTVVRDLRVGRYYWRCSARDGAWSQPQEFTLKLTERTLGR